MSHVFDIAVIGGGAAGCAAAVEAARLGARVALVERERLLGGASWHRGRLPARMLQRAVRERRSTGGVWDDPSSIELSRLLPDLDAKRRKQAEAFANELKHHGALRLHARAQIIGPHEIGLTSVRGVHHTIRANSIILATGDRTRSLRGARIDHEAVLDSGSILSGVYLPRTVVVAGSGANACEMAGLLVHLGCEVTLAVPGDRVLPALDETLGKTFLTSFKAAGGKVLWNHNLTRAQRDGHGAALCTLTPNSGGAPIELNPDRVVVATSRKASVRSLGLEALGITLDERGYLAVDDQYRTVVPSIRAVGAAIGAGCSSARMRYQAIQAARWALSQPAEPRSKVTPFVDAVLSSPELAALGEPERNVHGAITSMVIDADAGLKLIADAKHRVVGMHAWGPGAEKRLRKLSVVVQDRWSVSRLAQTTEQMFERPRQAARSVMSHGAAGDPEVVDPEELLAGIVRMPGSNSAA